MFIHDANNKITVGQFSASLADFLVLEPTYRLPQPAIWQFYVPGVKHLVGDGFRQRSLALPWIEGDGYLANESSYTVRHPNLDPDVHGFEAALIQAFAGDFLAINTLYAAWPLFKDALESAQWPLADLILTTVYQRQGISTGIYVAIATAARANHIPIARDRSFTLAPVPESIGVGLVDQKPSVVMT